MALFEELLSNLEGDIDSIIGGEEDEGEPDDSEQGESEGGDSDGGQDKS
jgi:hypothetical protein